MSSLSSLTITEARDKLAAGDVSSREITQDCLAAIEQASTLNAVIEVTSDKALDMADAADAKLRDGGEGALLGIPLGIKDLFCTEGVRSQAASGILDGFLPPYESTVTANLWKAGGVMLGKLNMDEFAMGSSTETSTYGPCLSPWRRGGSNAPLSPGGSSGGSSTAVAADLCLGATGTDTGGSIR
ncbi:MAG: amidase, partial [Pseudomonadota bacterium]